MIFVEARPYADLIERFPDEDRMYQAGNLWTMSYSSLCVEGEEGHHHMSALRPITPERFEAARAAGWDLRGQGAGMDGPGLGLDIGDGAGAGAGAGGADPAGSLTVSQFHQALGEAVASAGLVHLWVTGTVTGLRPGPKFTTFELVDYDDDGATVGAVLSVGVFARHAPEIRKTLALAGAELVDGLEVSVWGPLDLNARYGRLRLLAQRVDPRTTVGAAVLARDGLVAELERCGRLRAQAALVVPALPRRIGLVSSCGAAGRADVLEVLARSPLPLDVVEATAAMSGPGAPGEVARALELLAGAGVDVILIARGGGAKSDLAAWESRPVAMAITACPVPIWTALGHATDHTLADSLAQACHPTPSAAAGALVGRAEAAVRAEERTVERLRHEELLAASRRRARVAIGVAVVVVLVVMAIVLITAP